MDPGSAAAGLVGGLAAPDRAFVEEALSRGIVTREGLPAAVAEYHQLASEGRPQAIAQILVRRRLVSVPDFQAIWREVARRLPSAPSPSPAAAAGPAGAPAESSGVRGSQAGLGSAVGGSIPRFGPFEIRGEIARGGMGVVYRAHDPRLGREVALKVLRSERPVTAIARERFRREAAAAGKVDHPNIVKIHEAGTIDGLDYYVMEYVRGEPLDAYARSHALSQVESLRIVRDLARALQMAHEVGVVHRDIKPQNILVDPTGIPRLVDFGLAKVAEAQALTKTGSIMGTPFYMSPEQASGRVHDLDRRSDIFSLGVVLFELVCGRRPFLGDTPAALYRCIQEERTPVPSRLAPAISRDLDRVLLAALEKEPAQRYPTMEAFAADLDRILLGQRVKSQGGSSVRRAAARVIRHRRFVLVLLPPAVLLGFLAFHFASAGGTGRSISATPDALAGEAVRSLCERIRGTGGTRRPGETFALAPLAASRLEGARLVRAHSLGEAASPPGGEPGAGEVADLLPTLGEAFRAAGYPLAEARLLDRLAAFGDGPPSRDLLGDRAAAYLRAGRPEQALAVLEGAGDGAPGDLRARAYLLAGRADEAERLLDRLIVERQEPTLFLLRAESRIAAGRLDAGQEDLDRAQESRSLRGRVAVLRSRLLDARGEPVPSILAWLAEEARHTADPAVQMEYARRLHAMGRADLAIPLLEEIRRAATPPEGLDLLLARARLDVGDAEAARSGLAAAVAVRPGGPLLFLLGEAQLALGLDAEAEGTLGRALLRGDPAAAGPLARRALARSPADLVRALRLADDAGRLAGADPGARLLAPLIRAWCAEARASPAEAVAILTAAGDAAEQSAAALALRGRLRLADEAEQGAADLARARTLFGTEALAAPSRGRGLRYLAAAEARAAEPSAARLLADRAASALAVATALAPDDAAAWGALGRARLLAGERAAAREALTRAMALDPTDAAPLEAMGRLVLAEGSGAGSDRASRFVEAALARGAGRDARLLLARAQLAEGDAPAAAASARSAVDCLRQEPEAPLRELREALLFLAQAEDTAGDHEAAATAHRSAGAIDERIQRAELLLADARQRYKDRDEGACIALAQQALDLDPAILYAHHALAKAYLRSAQLDLVLYHFAVEYLRNESYAWEASYVLEQIGLGPFDFEHTQRLLAEAEDRIGDRRVSLLMRFALANIQFWARPLDSLARHQILEVTTELRDLAPEVPAPWLADAMALAMYGEPAPARSALGDALLAAGATGDGEAPGRYGPHIWAALALLRLGRPDDLADAAREVETAVARGAPLDADQWDLQVWEPIRDRPILRRLGGR